jgi:hypothetical protein
MAANREMHWMACAIAFAVVMFAVMFRFQYERAGTVRINRWSGERLEHCELNNGKWVWVDDCFQSQQQH